MNENAHGHFAHLGAFAATDIGRKRKNNEDAHGEFPDFGVWCVADGMGGGDDGEVASAAVVKSVGAVLSNLPVPQGGAYAATDIASVLSRALDLASAWIYDRARRNNLKGCGSTFVGVLFDPSCPGTALALHVGDSRLYRFRGRDLKQITKDHSVAEMMGTKNESELNPMFRGMILRAVGIEKTVDVEETPFSVREDDIVLVCSDGLTRMVPDAEIARILRNEPEPIGIKAQKLIAAANAAGGVDNITVSLVRVGALPTPVAAVALPKEDDSFGSSGSDLTGATHTAAQRPEMLENIRPSGSRRRTVRIAMFVAAALLIACAAWLGAYFYFGRQADAPKADVRETAVGGAAAADKGRPAVAVAPAAPAAPAAQRTKGSPSAAENVYSKHMVSATGTVARAESVSEDAERAQMLAQLKAQRERRKKDADTAEETDRRKHAAALELAPAYYNGAFANFAAAVENILGRGAGENLQKRAKDLYMRRNDADVTESATAFAAEVVAVAKRIDEVAGKAPLPAKLMQTCARLAHGDPADPAVQRACAAFIKAFPKQKTEANGGK